MSANGIEAPETLRRHLQHYRQEHVLAGWDRLAPEERRELIELLEKLDLADLQRLHALRDRKDALPDWHRLAPLPRRPDSDADGERFRQIGEQALRDGEVAFFVVAGGQGTRLGFDRAKGLFPVGPVSGKSLYQLHAEKVLALSRRYGKPLPLLIMTSPATHDETVRFLRNKNELFGLAETQVSFLCQGTAPALDFDTGRLLLEAPGKLALSPNGHGGTLQALQDHRAFDRLGEAGIRTLFYFQVDNPLTDLTDVQFLGRHLAQRAEVSTKALPKKHPHEKMGNLALVDGRCSIIEYSDLPDEWCTRTDDQGGLFFWAGNTAIHLFDVDFLRRISARNGGVPWHLARKKVPYLDAAGQLVQPVTENALKFERFIFDVLPLAERWTVAATTRARDFEPLKNATGPDSPETVRRALIDQSARWLEQVGVSVPRDQHGNAVYPVEISPLLALDAEELKRKIAPGSRVERPFYFDEQTTS